MLNARDEPAIDALGFVAPVLYRMPPALVARWYAGQTAKIDLQASNVAGLPWEAYIAGAKIERMLPFGPVPGCAVMATLLSYAGTCCIGISCDAAAVRDPGLIMTCVQQGQDVVLALPRGSNRSMAEGAPHGSTQLPSTGRSRRGHVLHDPLAHRPADGPTQGVLRRRVVKPEVARGPAAVVAVAV